MSSAQWDEIKRLAADFQKAQLSTTVLKLSERNCVEIITKLIEAKLLHVIFTNDGKEYVTPDQLVREIKDELFVHGGRINLVELAKILNIDLSHITEKATEIQKSDSSCTIILGQLIDKTYLKQIALEINERLSQHGQISIGDLTRHYDLPGDFLQSVVEKQLGKIIHGKQDKTNPRLFFTEAFVTRNRSCIRGALAAVTKPIAVTPLLSQCGVPDRLFYSLIDSLIEGKEVHGVVTGRQGGNGIYVPTIYSKSQNDWVNSFYKQNGYLEYDALTRLGISDAHVFVRKHFPNEKLMHLSSCAVGPQIFDQVEAAVEEATSTNTFVDIMPMLPSVFEPEDAEEILKEILKQSQNKSPIHNIHIFCGTIAVTDHFIQRLTKLFDEVIKEKAEHMVTSGAYLKFHAENKLQNSKMSAEDESGSKGDKREERRKKATGGKGGGGTQGRETKTKSTKKKYQRGKNAGGDSDSDTPQSTGKSSKPSSSKKLELFTIDDIREVIEGEDLLREDDLVELVTEISTSLYPSLNKIALATTEAIYEASMASSAQLRRKTHSDLQDKLNTLVINVRQFEKGFKNFPNKDIQQQLAKYLLKTVCTEVANDIFGFVAQENMIQYDHTKELLAETRMKIMNDLRGESKDALMKLHKSLTADTLDDFMEACEPAMGSGVCDMVLRKHDKKKEKNILFGHRTALLEQLFASEDPSLVLHLAVVILFQTITQTMLHASGRFVLQVLNYIRPSLPTDIYKTLQNFHDMVMKLLAAEAKGDGENDQEEIKKLLIEDIPKIKTLVSSFKRASTSEKQAETGD